METEAVIERVERIAAVRARVNADTATIESALTAEREVRAWLDASNARLVSSLAAESSFPESAIAAASKGSLGAAGKRLDRSKTLEFVPSFAGALDDGAITAGHVDAITCAGNGLDGDQRAEFHERMADLVDVASAATEAEFGRRARDEARRIRADDGMGRFERQQRAASLRGWVDREGMWNLRGRFDPLSGVRIASALEGAVDALFAGATPDTAPADPVEKQAHLRALALDRLVTDPSARRASSGRPEFVVVIDAGRGDTDDHPPQPGPSGAPHVGWPLPVEVPWQVLADLAGDAEIDAVVVRNGVVLHAPGRLDMGRTTRLANRAQRRALRGLYSTCAIPGCATHYDQCKLHHVIWWRHGGRTDLDNLLPLCSRHHHKVHDDGWHVVLGPHRELALTLPDGTVRNTGPPSRRAA